MICDTSEELIMILAIFGVLKKSVTDSQQTDNAKDGMEIFGLKKLNYVEDKEQHQAKISNRFAA
jgi:hypothetical protein